MGSITSTCSSEHPYRPCNVEVTLQTMQTTVEGLAYHVAHGAAGFRSPVSLMLLHGAAQPKVSKLGSQPSSSRWVEANQHVAGILQQSKHRGRQRVRPIAYISLASLLL
jgi:hypothetical protein